MPASQHAQPKSDIEISQAATKRLIADVARERLGVAVEADGFTVVCADGRFKVTRVQPADGKKIDAGEFATSVNLAAGARFT